jgi:hypothetical protein
MLLFIYVYCRILPRLCHVPAVYALDRKTVSLEIPESDHFLALVRAYSDIACGACGTQLRYIKGTQDGTGRINYTFYFCDGCDVEWRLRRRKE